MALTFHICEIPQSENSDETPVINDEWLDALKIKSGFRTLKELVSYGNIDSLPEKTVIAMENGQRRVLGMNETLIFNGLVSEHRQDQTERFSEPDSCPSP